MAHLSEAFRLSGKDYLREWRISGSFIVALAAVLGPMMVLFGLKFGVIGSMVDELVHDPRNREVLSQGSGRYDLPWIEKMAQRPDVAFIVPRTRRIAADMQLASKVSNKIINVELIPSGAGDPLLEGLGALPSGANQIVLSELAAQKLMVKSGDTIDGSIARMFRGKAERQHLDLKVVVVAPAALFNREAAFVAVDLLQAVEDFRDGHRVASLGWDGVEAPGERIYPGFRLYAKTLDDVAALQKEMIAQGFQVRTRAEDIAVVKDMDRNLTLVFWVIAVIGLAGFALSLGASLLANVDRKRRELSVLRLVGFHTGDIILFPVLQSVFTGLVGWFLASGIFFGVSFVINKLFADQLAEGQSVCRLLPEHFIVALVLTIAAAVIAAMLGGLRASRIEPSEGLRDI
ncbi:MAG: ABC transporter permease [Gammaproteobacteria bacterium]|nr:ABC transporter permease [Gammaproteobacteria bacterium]MBU1654721.1 ABC transporter permease [Gammaproteobacteria bacterium]MBU1959642.1 ABC transporter permease [Gammaproteobacteria bacterium]